MQYHVRDPIHYRVLSLTIRADQLASKYMGLTIYTMHTSKSILCNFFMNSSFWRCSVGSLGKFIYPIDVTVLNRPFQSTFLTHDAILSLLNSLSLYSDFSTSISRGKLFLSHFATLQIMKLWVKSLIMTVLMSIIYYIQHITYILY